MALEDAKFCERADHQGANPLPVTEFGANASRDDGLDPWCRACRSRVRRESDAAHGTDRVRENLSRRAAARQGLKLAKIARRDPLALGYGRWLLTDGDGKLVISHVTRGTETGAPLTEVEDYLGIKREPEPGTDGT